MKLFDEAESKYYELISYLLLQKHDFTPADIDRLYAELFQGEKDYETLDALFSRREGNEAVFNYSDGKYRPIMSCEFPVRCNLIEQQAFTTLAEVKYANKLLTDDIIAKIRKLNLEMPHDWNIGDITIKNQFLSKECDEKYTTQNTDSDRKLRIIAESILQRRSIIYDNIREGVYEYRNVSAFPMKIEYSFLNDSFRISAFHCEENRFFMMTLDTMRNVRIGNEKRADLQKEYNAFLSSNRRKVLLDVEPAGHVIERCFRIFSYHERKAIYNREDDCYRLEIAYNYYDEAEVVRDILSLGSSVAVLEPKRLRDKIRDRILNACRVYTD